MEEMPVILPPNVRQERSRHGKVVFYHRIGRGKRTRIYGDPRSKEFKEQAKKAEYGDNPPADKPKGGTLLWLVGQYEQCSPDILGLKPTTHAVYARIMRTVAENDPARKFSAINKDAITGAMASRTANAANNFLRAANSLFRWAVSAKYLTRNPCEGVHKTKAPKSNTHTWTADEIAHARLKWPSGSKYRLALEIGLCTGLARVDAVKFGRAHIDNESLASVQRTKTGVYQHFEILPELQAELDQTPLGFTFLMKTNGAAMSAEVFGNWFADGCKDIKLPDRCRFHGLRRACATQLADMGMSAHTLMAWLGWLTIDEAQLYTTKADRKRLAKSAAERFRNEKIPHLNPQDRTSRKA